MSAVSLPQFRVSKVFTLTEMPPSDLIDALLANGFVFEPVFAVNGKARKAPAVAKKIRRRRVRKHTPLTAERVSEFRKARASGKSYRRIGQLFGVTDARAWQIVNKGV